MKVSYLKKKRGGGKDPFMKTGVSQAKNNCEHCGTGMVRLGDRRGVQYWCPYCRKYVREELQKNG